MKDSAESSLLRLDQPRNTLPGQTLGPVDSSQERTEVLVSNYSLNKAVFKTDRRSLDDFFKDKDRKEKVLFLEILHEILSKKPIYLFENREELRLKVFKKGPNGIIYMADIFLDLDDEEVVEDTFSSDWRKFDYNRL